MAAQEPLPSTSDACAAAAAPAAVAAKPRPSALRRAKNSLAAHCSAASALLADNVDDGHVELADAALRALQALLHGRCVPSVEIARLKRVSHAYARQDAPPGTRALSLLGRAVRSMSIARNEHYTLADGLDPDEYGLPRISVKPPRFYRESDENTSPGGTQSQSVQHSKEMKQHLQRRFKEKPLFEGDTAPEQDTKEIWYTRGELRGATSSVDVSRLLPFRREDRDNQEEEEANRKNALGRKKYHPNTPAPPFEYKCDEAGNVLIKSEMMGDDEFFDHQIQMREFANRYEAIARTGEIEERFIMKSISGRGKIYECNECGTICPNQHKFAAHMRYAHPKTEEKRASDAAARVERRPAAADAAAPVALMERGKRERRPTRPHDETSHATTSSPPLSTKMYTCPICSLTLDSQFKYASHMRYKHPKGSDWDSMEGRRASVTKVQTASPSTPVTSSPLISLSTMTSSDAVIIQPVVPVVVTSKTTPFGEQKEANGETKKYTCKMCGRIFDSMTKLGGHTGHCNKARSVSLFPVSRARSLSTMPSSGVTKEDGETPKKMYACRICARPFDNYNGLAGHTRHCQNALNASAASAPASPSNGIAASPMTSSMMMKEEQTTSSSREKEEQKASSMTKKVEEKTEKKEVETPKKMYACHICSRPFDNHNSLAGHTRHCQNKNGVAPSPRAVQRREKAAADAAAASASPTGVTTLPAVLLAKKEPLPMSPLAVPSTPTADKETKEEEEKAVTAKKKPLPMSPLAVPSTPIIEKEKKEEEKAVTAKKEPLPMSPLAVPATPAIEKEKKEEEKVVTAKQVQRKRPASVAVKEESAVVQHQQPTPNPVMREAIAVSSAAAATPAAAAGTPMAKGKVTPPFTMATRASRSRATPSVSSCSLAEPAIPTGMAASSLAHSSPSLPPPAKRARTADPPAPNREVKEEADDEEETEGVKEQSMKSVKKENV